jgi:DNA-binding transcriptional ArsR family regulator
MDGWSRRHVARVLGVSPGRVRGLAERLDVRGDAVITEPVLRAMIAEVGAVPPIESFSRVEVLVLKLLSVSPLGLRSARRGAARLGLSPSSVAGALRRLEAQGIVRRTESRVVEGRPLVIEVWRIHRMSDAWQRMAGEVRRTVLPVAPAVVIERSVPERLRHLFWNAPKPLEIAGNEVYIADRLLSTEDIMGLAWGSVHLPADAWSSAAGIRGRTEPQRRLAQAFAQ